MALQSSGAISLLQIQAEWGGSAPISLSEYYLGSLPTSRTNYGTIPSSGAIDMADFYGTNSALGNWQTTLTVGNWTTLNGKIQNYGYDKQTFGGNTFVYGGALSDTTIDTFSNREVSAIQWANSLLNFAIFGNLSNSGWTRIITGSTSFYRSSATFIGYNSNFNRTLWQWSTTNPLGTSGTKTVTFII